MCGYFIFPDYNEHYRYFGRVVFALGIFIFIGGIRDTWRHPVFQAIVVYMLYLLLRELWSDSVDWYRLGQKFTISIYLLNFIVITHFLVRWNSDFYERMLQLSVLVAAAAALISLVVFYQEYAFPNTRVMGLGSLTNVNEFANVYAVFALLAMTFALREDEILYKILFLLPVIVFIGFVWFGQSRTAFVSMIFALFLLVGLSSKERKALYAGILITLVGMLVFVFPELVELALLRGEGLRPLIWVDVWDEIKVAPIVGYGFVSKMSVEVGAGLFGTAHNAYLQALWQGGIIGLGLFFLLLAIAFRYAWLWGRQHGEFTIFCMLVLAVATMTTGVDALIDRPRDQWMVFWFPLALLISYQSITIPAFGNAPKKA